MTDHDALIGLAVRLEREHRGWSQADLAKRLSDEGSKWHQQTVMRLENGQRALRVRELMSLADVFAVSASTLLGEGYTERSDEERIAIAYRAGVQSVIDAATSML